MDNISTIVALLVVLSIASERLVEIIKALVPWLQQSHADQRTQSLRNAAIHCLAMICSIVTALIAAPAIEGIAIIPADWTNPGTVIALGLLASGGSGFWNSIQSYLLRLKNLKKLEYKPQAEEV